MNENRHVFEDIFEKYWEVSPSVAYSAFSETSLLPKYCHIIKVSVKRRNVPDVLMITTQCIHTVYAQLG